MCQEGGIDAASERNDDKMYRGQSRKTRVGMMCRRIRIMYGDIDKGSYKSMDRYGGGGEQRI